MSGHAPVALGGLSPDLEAALAATLEREPEPVPTPITLDRRMTATTRFGLRTLFHPVRGALALAVALVALESLALQVGPLLMQRAIDDGIAPGNLRVVVVAAALYLASVVTGHAAATARMWWTGRLGQRLMKGLRLRVFTHLQRLSQAYFTQERVGRLLTRMTSDIEALSQLLQDGIVNLIVQVFTLLIVSAAMLLLDWRLGLLVIAIVGPSMLAATLWFRTQSARRYGVVRERVADVLADLQENLSGARVITATNRQARNQALHAEVVERHRRAELGAARIQAFYVPSVDAIQTAGQVAILLIGGRMLLSGALQIGELTAFVFYLAAFFEPIEQLVNLYNTYQSGQAAVTKLAGLLEDQPTVAERADPIVIDRLNGAIELDHVTFGYAADRPVVSDVTLTIPAGETVALVGATGAGKSTLAKLLTRTYDPQHGAVRIDGLDVRDCSLTSLRSHIGVVPQEPFLFSGTLRDNLALGFEVDDEAMSALCEQLGLGGLLERLGGVDGRLAERGAGLSSGERQLIALARALLRQPSVLVLDEATSNLDLKTERLVEHALDIALEGRTAILVAHRLSTAERADRVVVLDGGRVVEVGRHEDLVADKAHYAEMFATWEAAAGAPSEDESSEEAAVAPAPSPGG